MEQETLAAPRTVMEAMAETVKKYGDHVAMRVKIGGEWKPTTWNEYHADTRRAAKALIAAGLTPGKGVTILGFNRPEWFIASLGAVFAGGLPAGIYTTNSAEQCHYIAKHAEAVVAIVENQVQLEKFLAIRGDLDDLRLIVLMDGASDHEGVISWDEFLAMSGQIDDAQLEERIVVQKTSDLAELIYTSGTTGDPKAVMLSHENLTFTGLLTARYLGVTETDRLISYLPLSHIAEQILSLYTPLCSGACSWFAEGIEQMGDNLQEVKPTIFLGVPRVWEKIQAKMQAVGASAPPLRKKIVVWAKGVGLAGGYADQKGTSRPLAWGLANKLIFSKVRAKLGLDEVRICLTSAAPISVDTLEFFLSLGIPIYEVYGMSECTGPTTLQVPGQHKTGTIGPQAPGTEVRLADDGEVLIRGPHVFLGYYKDEIATKETIDDDGWLHSGDVGVVDDDAYFKITDRKKDLIITAGGHNIAPQVIEKKLGTIPGVGHAVVVGDRRAYLIALFTIDSERLASIASAIGSEAADMDAASKCEKFRTYIESQVDVINRGFARNETIKKFSIVPREFTIEGDELTPTMKLKRRVVYEKYKDLIDALYA